MVPARIPLNDIDRVKALQRANLLDLAPDDYLNGVVKSLASYYQVDIALVSLLDAERQWFRASWGLEEVSTPRDWAFCGYSILSTSAFVVPDARKDQRFHDNPLVTGPPYIRYYAGVPIYLDDGLPAGSVCLIDPEPRFQEDQLDELSHRAALVQRYIQKNYVKSPTDPILLSAPAVSTRIDIDGAIAVVSVNGDLRIEAARKWYQDIASNVELALVNELIVDLEGCGAIDSSGIGVLVKLHKHASSQNRTLRFRNLQPIVAKIFERLRLTSVMHIE